MIYTGTTMIFLLPKTDNSTNENKRIRYPARCVSSVNTRHGTFDRGTRFRRWRKKTTPKLADLSPVLVYFSVIPFSPVAKTVLFLTSYYFVRVVCPFRRGAAVNRDRPASRIGRVGRPSARFPFRPVAFPLFVHTLHQLFTVRFHTGCI